MIVLRMVTNFVVKVIAITRFAERQAALTDRADRY